MPRDSFPRRSARTRRFTLGEPRTFTVAPDGSLVAFLRSRGGEDATTCLWALDLATGTERLVADPADLLTGEADADLPEAERRRRERARESAEGITAYATDDAVEQACFAVAGQLFVTDLRTGATQRLETVAGVFDPRFDPTGHRIAYVADGALRLVGRLEGDRTLVGEDQPEVTWGLAEFIAGEEMGRNRGFWWSPTGQHLAVARGDNTPVEQFHLADPAHPERPASLHRYPRAGTANAIVDLAVVDLDGVGVPIRWDHDAFPYLANVFWQADRPLTLVVQSRDQRTIAVLVADITTGETRSVHAQSDPRWVELVAGAPRWFGDQLVTVVDRDATRRVVLGDRPLTPRHLQVRHVVGALADGLLVTASPDPTVTELYHVRPGAPAASVVTPLTKNGGVAGGVGAGNVVVAIQRSLDFFGSRVEVLVDGTPRATIANHAASPRLQPRAAFHVVGKRALRSVVLLPREGTGHTAPYPVLCDPYGGPHAQRVVRSRNDLLTSQWFADQGFAVVVTDGRGTPARGPAWERAVWGDLAAPVLADQVDALHALAEADDRLDLTRVGIRGWSFGGYLAALAVLRRPDVFHAAVAGAPVTDWSLYDTHYTERYLGHPDTHPGNYERTNLLRDAKKLRRPLLLVHGLADDNVVVAHTLQLSSALLAAGRPHQVLPLSGVTHMTPQEVVAENLLKLQVAFLQQALGTPAATS